MPVKRIALLPQPNKKSRSKIARKKLELRTQLWPSVSAEELWDRQRTDGWLTVPRALPLTLRLMDTLSNKGKPVSSTYLDLWCRTFDDSFVIVTNPNEMAFCSGFTGERAQSTWVSRVRILESLGFISVKPGVTPVHYILIFNPFRVLKKHHEEKRLPDSYFSVLVQRMLEVGATDLET